jgi:hypothetical protein
MSSSRKLVNILRVRQPHDQAWARSEPTTKAGTASCIGSDYLGLNSQTFTAPAGGFLAGDTFTTSNPNVQMVKVGVNYLFNYMGWATDRRSLQPRGRQSTAMPSRSFRSPMCWTSLRSVALASATAIQLPVVEQHTPHAIVERTAAREGRCAAVAFLLSLHCGGFLSEEFLDMCDYSLHSVRTRPAKVGEKLVTRNFGTGTRGFAAPDDCRPIGDTPNI